MPSTQAVTGSAVLEPGGQVLVVHHEQDTIAIERAIADQRRGTLPGHLQQRLRHDQSPLQFIDFVVDPLHERDPLERALGQAVDDLEPALHRAFDDIRMPQVVQRPTGAEKLVVAQCGLGLGRKRRQLAPLLARLRRIEALPLHVGAVESAVVLGELRTIEVGVEVADHRLRIVPLHLGVQAALRVGLGDGRRVVAVDRVVLVRVDVAEQPPRVLAVEVADDLVQLLLLAVQLGGQQVLAADLALEEERDAPLGQGVLEVAVVSRERLHRSRDVVLLEREIGDADHEHLLPRHVDRKRNRPDIALFRNDVEEQFVPAHGQEGFVDEPPLRVDRNHLTVEADRSRLGHPLP